VELTTDRHWAGEEVDTAPAISQLQAAVAWHRATAEDLAENHRARTRLVEMLEGESA
jgi:hypothetical protein